MVLKTFNLNEETYNKFSKFCKENGISMSKQVNFFIELQMSEDKIVREEYIRKLETIRKGKFISIGGSEELEARYT